LDIRKVQRVGHSTLTVSLPSDWVKQVGLRQGGIVTISLSEFGELIVTPGSELEGEESTFCKINADVCADGELLGRVITGNYILGRDTIIVSSGKGLSREQEAEIRRLTHRLSGLGVVEQSRHQTIIQCFLDPAKFSITDLLSRLHKVALSMLETSMQALMDHKYSLALQVLELEGEADRLYWLILRQIFRAISKIPLSRLGIESTSHAVGYRAVSKYLEKIADCSESIANQIIIIADENYEPYTSMIGEICKLGSGALEISKGAMNSLSMLDIELSNKLIVRCKEFNELERDLTEQLVASVQNRKVTIALKSILWNLSEISRCAKMICEVAINRYLESNTEICSFWKERTSGGKSKYLKKLVA
jgi:phosphate uptake regulator